MFYRLRIDINDTITPDLLLQICESTTHVMVRHELPHGNPHYHLLIDTDVTDKALRLRFTRKLNISKSDYSVKKCDLERKNEYVQYMFNTKHGNKWELISSHNFDLQLIDSLIQAAKEISTEFQDRAAARKSKGPTLWDLAMEVEEQFKTKFTVNDLGTEEIEQYYAQQVLSIETYTDIAIKVLRSHRKAFDEFLLRKIISTAISSTEKGKDILRKKMLKNFVC